MKKGDVMTISTYPCSFTNDKFQIERTKKNKWQLTINSLDPRGNPCKAMLKTGNLSATFSSKRNAEKFINEYWNN